MKDKKDILTANMEDLFLWPDGSSCYRYELHEMSFKSDDFVVLKFGSPEYMAYFENKVS